MFKSFFKKQNTYEQFDHSKESKSTKLTEFPKYDRCCFGIFKKERQLTDEELESAAKNAIAGPSNENTPLLKK